MRIAYLGVPEAGIVCFNAVMQAKKNVTTVVTPPPNHPMHNIMANLVEQCNIPYIYFEKSPKEEKFIQAFKESKPDIAVVCAFDHKLPKELLEIPPLGFINCHPSLLPDYRGGNPFFHVIANDEKRTGVTIHYMDEGFDTGDIISQWVTDVAPDETIGTLFNRLNLQTTYMVLEILNNLENGHQVQRAPQITVGEHKRAPIVYQEKGDTIINWVKDAAYIERFTRALNPFFGATTYFRGCAIKIWSANYSPENKYDNYPPGTIAKVTKDNISIVTGKGLVFPTSLQIGSFLISDIKDFIRRTNPQPGEAFTAG